MKRMHKILLVLCGGTICTAINCEGENRVRSISDEASALLVKNYRESDSEFVKEVGFDITKNFKILSENMTVGKWNELIDYFREHKDSLTDYDGIIVAHGTDTLAYSVSLFSLLLGKIGVPVLFVSSNEPLESKRANGNINFRKAVECICLGIRPNVYAVYKNPSSDKVFLHLGSRLMQCRNYEEDFYSVGAVDISYFDGLKNTDLFVKPKLAEDELYQNAEISLKGTWHLEDCILKIDPYVGLNYDFFDYSKFKAILHETYHSGTVCAEKTSEINGYSSNSFLHLLDKCKKGPDVYLSPSKKTGDIYDSIGIIANHDGESRVHFMYGCTNEMTYVKLLLAYALEIKDVDEFMKKDFNQEHIY